MEGIDCATPLGATTVARLRAGGKRFVCRYLAPSGPSYDWKRLRSSEVRALRLARMGLVCVWETSANRALAGTTAGQSDARSAWALLKELGIPGAVVYFAVDFDARPEDQARINGYLHGAATVLGHDRVGIYGGYWPVKRALDAKACRYGWQTYAWSGGNRDRRAQLYQYRNGVRLAGISADLDRTYADDYGNAFGKAPKPAPKPKPAPVPQNVEPASGPYIYIRDKDGEKRWEPMTKLGAAKRFAQWQAGKFQELRFKRA